jgi:hypothetical protein
MKADDLSLLEGRMGRKCYSLHCQATNIDGLVKSPISPPLVGGD